MYHTAKLHYRLWVSINCDLNERYVTLPKIATFPEITGLPGLVLRLALRLLITLTGPEAGLEATDLLEVASLEVYKSLHCADLR